VQRGAKASREMKLLRFADLKARGIVRNWPTLKRWIEREGFPQGILLGPNSRAWEEEGVNDWVASRPQHRGRE